MPTKITYADIILDGQRKVIKEAEVTAKKLVNDYVTSTQALVYKYDKNIIVARKAKEELTTLRYQFHATSYAQLQKMEGKAITIAQMARGEGYRNYFEEFIPTFSSLDKNKQYLRMFFGGGFSDGIRNIIEAQRLKQGIDLSHSLWNYVGQGEADVWKAVYTGLQNNQSMRQIGRTIEGYLTDTGRQNMKFNLRRLIVSETNNSYLRSQEYMTKKTPWIKKVELYRGPDGDASCNICAEIIGGVGTSKTLTVNDAEYPPYHPFCKCGYIDVLPSRQEMIKYLKSEKPLINRAKPKIKTGH